MTLSDQATMIESALADWAKANRGRVFIASDVPHVLEQLRAKPGTPTCAVLWTGRQPLGAIDRAAKKDNEWKVIVSRGRSLRLISGESLTEGAAGGRPMFDLVEEAETVVLSLRQDVDEDQDPEDAYPVHLGTGMWEVNGLLLDAMEIRFTLPSQATVQNDS